MTGTMKLLLGLALVWATAWGIAGYGMHAAGTEQLARAEHVAKPITGLVRGEEVRVEAVVTSGPPVRAPYSEEACIAALTKVFVKSSYRDAQDDRTIVEHTLVASRRAGPDHIRLAVDNETLELALDRWEPELSSRKDLRELPPRLGVTDAEIGAAKAQARGDIGTFSVGEALLRAGERFFVVARLEHRPGPLRLEPDSQLGKVLLFPGTQEELVAKWRGSGGGLRVAAWILGAGVGPLPLVIVGLVLFARARHRRH